MIQTQNDIDPIRANISEVAPYKDDATLCKSALEQDLMLIYGFREDVEDVVFQPIISSFNKNNSTDEYTPSVLINFIKSANKPNMIIDVHPREQWQTNWREWANKWKIMKAYCRDNGYTFRIYDESRISTVALDNIRLLMRFKHFKIEKEDQEAVLRQVRLMGTTTVDYLLTRFYAGSLLRNHGLQVIYHLLATKQLQFNLFVDMNGLTEVWVDSNCISESSLDRRSDDLKKPATQEDLTNEIVVRKKSYGFVVDYNEDGFDDEREIDKGKINLNIGDIYLNESDNKRYRLIEYLNEHLDVVIRNVETGKTCIVNVKSLSNIEQYDKHRNYGINTIGDEEWQKAQAKFEAIKPIISTEHSYNYKQLIMQRSEEINVPTHCLYRWNKQYESVGSITGMLEKKQDWEECDLPLTKEQDKIIQRVARVFYLKSLMATLEQTYLKIADACSKENINKPSKKAVRLRIIQITEYEQLKNKGRSDKKCNDLHHITDCNNEERQDFTMQIRQASDGTVSNIDLELSGLLFFPTRPKMPNLLILNDKKNSNTNTVSQFYRNRGMPFEENGHLIKPIVFANLCSGETEKDLYVSILEALHMPYKTKATVSSLLSQVVSLCKEYEVKMIIIDKSSSLAINALEYFHFMDAVEMLGSELQISIIIIGTQDIKNAIQNNPVYVNRFQIIEIA